VHMGSRRGEAIVFLQSKIKHRTRTGKNSRFRSNLKKLRKNNYGQNSCKLGQKYEDNSFCICSEVFKMK